MSKEPPKKMGRPTLFTVSTLAKLRTAFSYGCTDEEACAYSGVSVDALYKYQKANPDFLQEKRELKMKPALAARKTIVENIPKDLAHARWYASKKLSKEFGDKMEVNSRVTVEHKLNLNLADPKTREAIKTLDNLARAQLLKPSYERIQEAEESPGTEQAPDTGADQPDSGSDE